MEFTSNGELFDLLMDRMRLGANEAADYFSQTIRGLTFCHRHSICHRDLKPENLLLDEAFRVRVADFGFATVETPNALLMTGCGSPQYVAPEVITVSFSYTIL
jgi:serine/threonine protein kinase